MPAVFRRDFLPAGAGTPVAARLGGKSLFYWEGVMSKGQTYRTGVAIKDFGERMGHIKVLGVHIFGWCCGAVIRLGLSIRDSVQNCPITELYD